MVVGEIDLGPLDWDTQANRPIVAASMIAAARALPILTNHGIEQADAQELAGRAVWIALRCAGLVPRLPTAWSTPLLTKAGLATTLHFFEGRFRLNVLCPRGHLELNVSAVIDAAELILREAGPDILNSDDAIAALGEFEIAAGQLANAEGGSA